MKVVKSWFMTFLTSPGSCFGRRVTSFHLFSRSAQLPNSSSVHSFCTEPDPDSKGSSSSSSSANPDTLHKNCDFKELVSDWLSSSIKFLASWKWQMWPMSWSFLYACCLLKRPFKQTAGEQRMVQQCKNMSPATVAQVQIPVLTPHVSWVCCWFSPMLWEAFLWVLWFLAHLKR